MPGATIVLVLCYIVCRTDLYRHRIAGRESAWEAIAPAVDQSPVNPDRTAKLADALVCLAALEEPPVRFAAGTDAVATFEQRLLPHPISG
jgi:hypothetical protein